MHLYNDNLDNQQVIIYTDGACKGNPGIGAWAATLEYKGVRKEITGFSSYTTNNQMELTAVIEALKILKYKCDVIVYTDSQYVQKGITQWINGFKQRNWKNVKNVELWQELDYLNSNQNVTWNWVRGHVGNAGNEYVDKLANKVISEYLLSNK
jgi:ribonuclease HI